MGNNTDNNKRIAKNTLFLYGRMLFSMLVSIYTTRVLLDVLGIVDYGINNVVCGFVSMFAFLNTSMVNAIQRFYNYEGHTEGGASLKAVYKSALVIQVVLAIVTVVALETIGVWYINNRMVIPADRLVAANWIFQFSVISTALVILQIPYSSAILAHEKMDYYAMVSVLDVVLKLIFVFIIPLVPSDKLVTYGAFFLLVTILNFLLYYIYSKVKFPEIKYTKGHDLSLYKRMLSFSGWNVFESVAYTIKGQGLNVLINAFFGPEINAARGIASQLMGAIQGFSVNIVVAARPQLVESYAEGNYPRVKSLMYSMSKISYIMLFILSAPVIIEINYILHLWLKEVPDFTVPFVILVLVNMVISSLNTPVSQVVQAVGKIRTYQVVRSVIVIFTLPLSWIALKLGYNAVSVFWISLGVTVVNHVISLILLHKIFEYGYKDYFIKVIIPCILFSILNPILPLTIYFFMPSSFARLIIICLMSVLSGAIIFYYVMLNENEKQLVLSFVRKFKKH